MARLVTGMRVSPRCDLWFPYQDVDVVEREKARID